MNIFAGVLIILLAIYGLCELILGITLRLLTDKSERDVVILLPLFPGESDYEISIRSAKVRIGICRMGPHSKIVAIDCGLSPEERLLCDKLCKKHGIETA